MAIESTYSFQSRLEAAKKAAQHYIEKHKETSDPFIFSRIVSSIMNRVYETSDFMD